MSWGTRTTIQLARLMEPEMPLRLVNRSSVTAISIQSRSQDWLEALKFCGRCSRDYLRNLCRNLFVFSQRGYTSADARESSSGIRSPSSPAICLVLGSLVHCRLMGTKLRDFLRDWNMECEEFGFTDVYEVASLFIRNELRGFVN